MKKLFALVLTLALVFAIAAPAMALSWGPGATPTTSPYGVDVVQLQPGIDATGAAIYTAYPANLGVVAGTKVYFKVSITIPEDIGGYTPDTTGATAAASVAVKNINITKITSDSSAWISWNSTDSKIEIDQTKLVAVATDDVTYTAIIEGTVAKTADATATVSMGYSASKTLPITKKVGTVTYTFDAAKVSDGTNEFLFTITNSVITGWKLKTAARTYTVTAGPVFQYVDTTATPAEIVTLPTTDADYAIALAAYNGFVSVLGFKAGDANINYTSENVLANFGYTNKASKTATYKAYTANLTVTDGTNVPNTGDNMSVIGFVMVGLALLATAAVVVKKVRA